MSPYLLAYYDYLKSRHVFVFTLYSAQLSPDFEFNFTVTDVIDVNWTFFLISAANLI